MISALAALGVGALMPFLLSGSSEFDLALKMGKMGFSVPIAVRSEKRNDYYSI